MKALVNDWRIGSDVNIPGQGLSAALSGAGMGKDSGSTSSTTTAGISGIAGDTAKRTGDNAQGIGKIFDADKVRQEIQAQTKITQEFAKQASSTIQGYSDQQKQTLQDWHFPKPLGMFHSAVRHVRQSGAHFWLKFSVSLPIP